MKCPQCKLIEMFVKSVKENIVEHMCKKCGTIVKEEIRKE